MDTTQSVVEKSAIWKVAIRLVPFGLWLLPALAVEMIFNEAFEIIWHRIVIEIPQSSHVVS